MLFLPLSVPSITNFYSVWLVRSEYLGVEEISKDVGQALKGQSNIGPPLIVLH